MSSIEDDQEFEEICERLSSVVGRIKKLESERLKIVDEIVSYSQKHLLKKIKDSGEKILPLVLFCILFGASDIDNMRSARRVRRGNIASRKSDKSNKKGASPSFYFTELKISLESHRERGRKGKSKGLV